jgi:type IV secretory pathway VirB2 component (pilin)
MKINKLLFFSAHFTLLGRASAHAGAICGRRFFMKKMKIMRVVRAFSQSAAGRRLAAMAPLGLGACVQAFAQAAATAGDDINSALNGKVQIILNILSSPWVKGVACIALVAECIGMITAGRQEPGMFKKFIPWVAGTLLFLAAGTITSAFMTGLGADTFKFTN